jgi:hypothetical protein
VRELLRDGVGLVSSLRTLPVDILSKPFKGLFTKLHLAITDPTAPQILHIVR